MPPQEALHRRETDDPPPAAQSTATPPKATLFCPDCDRQEPVDGDWTEKPREYGVAVHCPRCDARLTLRPTYDADLPALVDAD